VTVITVKSKIYLVYLKPFQWPDWALQRRSRWFANWGRIRSRRM